MLIFRKEELNLTKGREKEWITSNGIGGWAASTILGLNTRRNHGYLIGNVNEEQFLFCAKVEEEITIEEEKYQLGINQFPGAIVPEGHKYIRTFSWNGFPQWVYRLNQVEIEKEVIPLHGTNAIIVSYKILSHTPAEITITPFLQMREVNEVVQKKQRHFSQHPTIKSTQVNCAEFPKLDIKMLADHATYTPNPRWATNIEYSEEEKLNSPFREDLFIPGAWKHQIKPGTTKINLLIAAGKIQETNIIFDQEETEEKQNYVNQAFLEKQRVQSKIKNAYHWSQIPESDLFTQLFISAEQFLIKKNRKTAIIAKYLEGKENIKDSCIALPGLCLATGKIQEAKELLQTIASYEKQGQLPNRFKNQLPVYEDFTVALWYIYAVEKFMKETKDYKFMKQHCWQTIKSIIKHYLTYTQEDGFLATAQGKTIEINALWYNALQTGAQFAKLYNEDPYPYLNQAHELKMNVDQFWNEQEQCLKNSLTDPSVAANQLLAIALPYPVCEGKEALAVVHKITQELYTDYGIRTLSPRDKHYRGKGKNNQGAIWPGLLGFYTTAYLKAHNYSKEAKHEMKKRLLEVIIHSRRNNGIGTISECYDGSYPYYPRGELSCAINIAELLRCFHEELK